MNEPKLSKKQLQALVLLEKTPDGMLAKSLGLKLGQKKSSMRQQVGSLTANKLVFYEFANRVKNRFVITDAGRAYLNKHPLPDAQSKTLRRIKRESRVREDLSSKDLDLAKELIRLIREIKRLLERV